MAEDIALLGIKVDSRQAKTADTDLDGLTKSARKAEKATDGLATSSAGASSSVGLFSGAVRTATGALGAFVGIATAGQLKDYADEFINIENSLKQVTESTLQLSRATAEVFDVANRTRSAVSDTATLYQRLAIATSELNLRQGELARLTETINKAFALSGATAAEAAGATRQLAQGLASGALRGDEFNSVAEQAPLIMRAIADETGLTIGQLREFAAEGGITAEIVIDALRGIEEEVDTGFSTSIATFEQKLNLASNALVAAAGNSEDLQSAVSTAGDVVLGAANATGFLLENLQLVAGILVARAIPAVGAYVIAQRSAIAATTAATVAARAYGASMALLGGPIGAIAVAGVALASWVSSTNQAEDSTERLAAATNRVSKELDSISDLGQLTRRADEVREQFNKVREELEMLEQKNREVDIYGTGNLFVAKERVIELRQQLEELRAELELVEGKQQSTFDLGIESRVSEGREVAGVSSDLEKAVEAAKSFADEFKRAKEETDQLVNNLERIQGIRAEREADQARPASVLGALISAGNARVALRQGDSQRASELALQAAEELRAVEEQTGKDVALAGTFFKNFEKIAQDALTKAEEAKEQLKLVIEIEGEQKEYDFSAEGVKQAGKDATAALKKAEKKRA